MSPTPREGSGVLNFAWSTNGKWLAYALYKDLTPLQSNRPFKLYTGVWQIRVDGSDATEIIGGSVTLGSGAPPPESNAHSAAIIAGWSRDSQTVFLWTYPFSASLLADGTALDSISSRAGASKHLTEMLAYPDFLSLSPDGKFLAVTEGGGRESWSNKRIVRLDLTNGDRIQLTDDKTTALSPAWSPDGQQIAYVAQPDKGYDAASSDMRAAAAPRRIWVMQNDGSNQHPLTNDPAYRDERPLWSADGRFILFTRTDKDMRSSVWLMHADGSELERIAELESEPDNPFGYYGHVDWDGYLDWRTRSTPTKLPNSGGARPNLWPILMVGLLMLSAGFVLIQMDRNAVIRGYCFRLPLGRGGKARAK
jgi:Tol biopolymer transport system component